MLEAVIIVAGGSGSRMKSDIPKQFLLIHKKPVLMHTIEQFYAYNQSITIVVVLPESQLNYWNELCSAHDFNIPHAVTAGGTARFYSVKNGLQQLGNEEIIGIHDGVRPLVNQQTIENCYCQAARYGAVIPVTDVIETIRKTKGDTSITVPRTEYQLVQTPQVFKRHLLLKAYDTTFDERFTDDASVVEHSGNHIHLVPGNRENIKITTPLDLKIAHALLNTQTS